MDNRCSNNYKILIVSIIIIVIFLLLNKNNTQITEQFENKDCAAHYGSNKACCGQEGNVSIPYICNRDKPICNDYVLDDKWGKCKKPNFSRCHKWNVRDGGDDKWYGCLNNPVWSPGGNQGCSKIINCCREHKKINGGTGKSWACGSNPYSDKNHKNEDQHCFNKDWVVCDTNIISTTSNIPVNVASTTSNSINLDSPNPKWYNLPISTRQSSILNRLNNYTTSSTEQFENISTTTSSEYEDPFEGFPDISLSELLTCNTSEWLEGA